MITVEDIEKRLAVKQAKENPDGTQDKSDQQEVPDAKSNKARSPWVDAGIGAAGGGLLGSALGYLYGHKGKWLAYDALAGGIAGGGVGYMIGSSNKKAPGEPSTLSEKTKNKLEDIYKSRAADDSYKQTFEELKNDPEMKGKANIDYAQIAYDTNIYESKGMHHEDALDKAKRYQGWKVISSLIHPKRWGHLRSMNPNDYDPSNLYRKGLKYVKPIHRTEEDSRTIVPLTPEELSMGERAFLKLTNK